MNQELKNILKQIADELSSMAHEDFIKMLDNHDPGEIAYFLRYQSMTEGVDMNVFNGIKKGLEEVISVVNNRKEKDATIEPSEPWPRPEAKTIRSGDYCKCLHCGNIGYVYGIAGSHGVSAPFCQLCGKNDKLLRIDKSN